MGLHWGWADLGRVPRGRTAYSGLTEPRSQEHRERPKSGWIMGPEDVQLWVLHPARTWA